MRRVIGAAVGLAAAVQVGPGATWLPPVRRRLAPGLDARGRPGSVAVTFDDGPHPEGTIAVLDQLDALSWSATFFLVGSQVRKYPDVVAEIVRRGHEVGVHGDEHRYLIVRSPRAAARDLAAAADSIGHAAAVVPRWWRPPYGVLSGPALFAAHRLGLRPVLWSSWGRDWRAEATPASVVDDLCAGGGARVNGATMLLHDSDVSSAPGAWRTTVAALPGLADRLQREGLRTNTLTKHLGS